MKFLLCALCVVGLGSVGFAAQRSADFSGTWRMDLSRSEAAAQGTPIRAVTVAISDANRAPDRDDPGWDIPDDQVRPRRRENISSRRGRDIPMGRVSAGHQPGYLREQPGRDGAGSAKSQSRGIGDDGQSHPRGPARVSTRCHKRCSAAVFPEYLDRNKRVSESPVSSGRQSALLGTAAWAARKPARECVPPQNGLLVEPPQRHNANEARLTGRYSWPFQSNSVTRPPRPNRDRPADP